MEKGEINNKRGCFTLRHPKKEFLFPTWEEIKEMGRCDITVKADR